MTTSITQPTLDKLPTELWVKALLCIKDPTFLWTVCRQVSQDFRGYVDTLFIMNYMPKTYIEFDLGRESTGDGARSQKVKTCFDRISDDKTRTVFVEEGLKKGKAPDTDRAREVWTIIMDKWQKQMDRYAKEYDSSVHCITVRRLVSDTEIPGLEIDYEKGEVSFDWREMYNLFFREQLLKKNYHKQFFEETRARLHEKRIAAVSDAFDPAMAERFIAELVRDCYSLCGYNAQRDVRRKRIRDHYKKHYDMDWQRENSEFEIECLERLRYSKLAATSYEFSDEELDGEQGHGEMRLGPYTVEGCKRCHDMIESCLEIAHKEELVLEVEEDLPGEETKISAIKFMDALVNHFFKDSANAK